MNRIKTLQVMTFLLSNVFGVWMVLLKQFLSQPADIKDFSKQCTVTSCRNVISIAHLASAVFIAFWLVLLFREMKNLIQFRLGLET